MSMAANVSGAKSAPRPMTKEEKRVILASSLGTVFEWYDFYLYGSLAVMIGAQFFSAFDPSTTQPSSRCSPSPPASSCARSARCVFGRLGDLDRPQVHLPRSPS